MKPPPGIGAWIGAGLTAGLIGVGYLGWKLVGLPFAPFDLFDWTTRAMPGAVVTFGIESMVHVSRTLHVASTSGAAKIAEQMMAIGLMFVGGTVVAALAFAVLRVSREAALLFGGVLGGMWGGAAVLMARQLNRIAPGDAWASSAWLFAGFLLWGLALGWSNDRLSDGLDGGGPLRAPTTREARNRRVFLRRFAGGLTTLTIVSTACGALVGALRRPVVARRWSDTHLLPNADAVVRAVPGTRAEFTALSDHYRIDADTRPPEIEAHRWRLRIGGVVDAPLALTLDDVLAYEPMHQFITLSCISKDRKSTRLNSSHIQKSRMPSSA